MSFFRQGKRLDLVRGAELSRHEYGLYLAALRFSVGLGAVAFACTTFFSADWMLGARDKEILAGRAVAHCRTWFDTPAAPVRLTLGRDGNARRYHVPAEALLRLTAPEWPLSLIHI